MTLAQCIEYATAHNINVKRYENAVEQQKLQVSNSRNSRLPEVSAGASQSFNFGRGLNSSNSYVNRNTQSTGLNIQASVPLLTGGKIHNETAMNRLNMQAATADLEHARQSVALQVAAAYLQAVYAGEVVKTYETTAALSKVQESRLEKLFDAGKKPQSDVVEAKAQVAQDEMQLTQAKCDRKLAMLELSQLLEIASPDSIEVATPQGDVGERLISSPEQIYSQAVQAKPEIKAEKLRLEAAERNVKVAKAALYPTLSLGAGLSSEYYKTSGYGAPSFTKQLNDNFNKSIGLSLNIPVFNRYATRNAIRMAKLQRNEQMLKLDDTHKALFKEIQQAYYNAVNAQAKYRSSVAAKDAAQAGFEVVTGKYENGNANATELEEAKTKLLNAANACLQSKYEYILRTKIIDYYKGKQIN